MKIMKYIKTGAAVTVLALTVLMAGCSKGDSQDSTAEVPVDIVSEIAGTVSEETETTAMDETVQKIYKILLDGTSDADAVYYLVDVTGNGSPELIVGNQTMNVYSCNQGAVTSIGSMVIDEAYLSQQYGFMVFCNQDNQYELVQYKYDGEMITEKILVSATSESDYKSQSAGHLADARKLQAFTLDDKSSFSYSEE